MKIAVLGAGFAGLATAWFLLNQQHHVTIYDPLTIGGGTSGIAAGLLHPFVGKYAKLNWMGREGMEATQKLLSVAEETLKEPIVRSRGILRPALTKELEEAFRKCASLHEDVEWCERERCQELCPGVADVPGIYVKSGLTIHCGNYLSGLWSACKRLGAEHVREKVVLEVLDDYDAVYVCTGAELEGFQFTPVKGQILTLEGVEALPISISAGKYLSMDDELCYAGATYERGFTSVEPDIGVAKDLIMPVIGKSFPGVLKGQVIGCRAGVRASTPNRRPILAQVSDRVSVFSGLGSRGLLYHAYFAEQLVNSSL